MDTLYIGTKYTAGTLAYDDGSEFQNTVKAVLFNRVSQTKEELEFESGETELDVTFPASQTANIVPGIYDLEIYEYVNDEPVMIYYKRDYANAINVSVSEDTNSQNE